VVAYAVISLRPEPRAGTWWTIRGLKGVDAEAAYGCVDWYLYQDAALPACPPKRGPPAAIDPAGPATFAYTEVRPDG